jgi:hypothetical protein
MDGHMGKIILKLKKVFRKVGCIRLLQVEFSGGSCEQGNKMSGFTKCGACRDYGENISY